MRRRSVLKTIIVLSCVISSGPNLGYCHAATKRELYDVTQFGAKGDGYSDDTEAIRRALAHAARSKKPTHLFFPKGLYVFSSLEEKLDDVEFSGDESTLVSTLPLGSGQAAIWLHARRLWVHDLALDYMTKFDVRTPGVVQSRRPNAYGLRLGGARDPTNWIAESVQVERMDVRHARGGGIQVSYAENVTVRDCRVQQVLGNGIGFDNCIKNVIAEDNYIALTGDDLLVIVTDDLVPNGTVDVVFRRNIVTQGYAKGIASSGVNGMIIEKNNISKTFAGGIVVFSDTYYRLGRSQKVTLIKNVVEDAGSFYGEGQFRDSASSVGNSIYIAAGSADVTICGNTLKKSVRDGIVATTIDGLSIINNSLLDHPGVGILVGDIRANEKTRVRNFEIKFNSVRGNRDGIVVGSAMNGVITGNDVMNLADGHNILVTNSYAVSVHQ